MLDWAKEKDACINIKNNNNEYTVSFVKYQKRPINYKHKKYDFLNFEGIEFRVKLGHTSKFESLN